MLPAVSREPLGDRRGGLHTREPAADDDHRSGQPPLALAAVRRHTDLTAGRLVLAERRGRSTFLIMWVRDGPLVSCFSANGRSGCPATVTPRLPPPAAGRASLRDVDWSGSGRGRYALASGQVGSGVTGVDVVLPDGRSVQATVGNGWWAAWWPGEETADVRIVAR